MLFAAVTNGGADPWPAFLGRLAADCHADLAVLQVRRPGQRLLQWAAGAEIEVPDDAAVDRMRSGRVYSQVDFPSAALPALPLRALRWTLHGGATVLLAVQRRGEDFRAADGVPLVDLVPHFGTALTGWLNLSRERSRAGLDRQACADLGAGWIVFSAAGQVADMAPGLADRLAPLGVHLRADGWLHLPDPDAAQRLRRAVLTASAHPACIEVSRAPLVQIVVTAELPGGEEGVVGRVRHEVAARGLPLDRVMACFDLSRSEARLVLCLCDGLSLQQAAVQLDWTLETARSCSKRVFARMDESGQTGVIRRVLNSAVWLA